MGFRSVFLYSLLLGASLFSTAQNASDSTQSAADKKGLLVLPATFYSPETSVGFGAAGIYYFRSRQDTLTRPSNVQSIAIYTLENQILFTNPYNLFFQNTRYWLRGETGFYVYPYEFYGIGPDVSIDRKNAEFYEATFLRFELNALRKLGSGFYAGPALFLDQYFNISVDPAGQLAQQQILGIEANRLFAAGLTTTLDRRNNIFSPYQGYYLEGRLLRYEHQLIGHYRFTDFYLDIRKYFHLWEMLETSLQFFHQSVLGDPPFYNYALLGGGKLMRGYYKGAYRDHHQSVLQGEMRRYLFPRVLLSVFGGVGAVNDRLGQYDRLLPSYGAGLRFEINSEEHLRIRVDYARGAGTSGFYLNINEAF